ncbi:MAG: hypothetical protein ACE5EX_07540 [Phycisphaerae bacterium]
MSLREARLDRIEAGKARLWRAQLRLTQVVNGLILGAAVPFVIWQDWAYWAAAVAAAWTVTGMWGFARWMGPREQRLRRHMVALARWRRRCVRCGYRLRDLTQPRCPECGAGFDFADTRRFLGAATLHRYSARARMISAVVIVAVLFWVSALARGAAWPWHVSLALGLAAAFHGLHLFWRFQAGRDCRTAGQPPVPQCVDCGHMLRAPRAGPPNVCPGCDRRLTYGEVFIRPDARRLTDARLVSIQYRSLVLRWVFLVAVCGGLTVLVHLDPRMFRSASFGRGRSMLFVSLGLPVLFWVAGSAVLFRHLARRLQQRLRLLFAQIAPTCPRCETDLSPVPVGDACPRCRRRPNLQATLG